MLASYNSETGSVEWLPGIKKEMPELSEEVNNFFNLLKSKPDINFADADGFVNFAKNSNVADSSFQSFLTNIQKSGHLYEDGASALKGYQSYLQSVGGSLDTADVKAKALSASTQLLSSIGSSLASMAIDWVINKAAEAIDNYIHRLDRAKEAFKNTESEISSVKSEIETTAKQIKELESIDSASLSISDKEDLQRLKDQNEELRIREQYLEKQRLEEADKVAVLAKEKYHLQYDGDTGREEIEEYKKLYESEVILTPPGSSYLSGESSIQSTPYGAAQNAERSKESNSLANLIAQYELYSEEKKKAIQMNDSDTAAVYDGKLDETVQKLTAQRTFLQTLRDDLFSTGEASPELDEIVHKLEQIDNMLLTPSHDLVNFLNEETLYENKEKLIALANAGKLTQEELSANFSETDQYLRKNGLTLEDLISTLSIYKEELNSGPDAAPPPLSVSDTITQLNTQLKPALDTLKSAYQEIFTENGFTIENADFSMLNNIKSSIDELNSIEGIDVDYASYENLVKILNETAPAAEDVQKAFNELTSSITRVGLTGTEDFKTLTSALEDFGIENSEMVAFDNLISNTEALKEAGLDLATASEEQITAFANEVVSAENIAQAIDMLTFAKLSADAASMDTSAEVANLKTLAENAGYTGEIIQYLTELEQIYQEVADGNITIDQLGKKLARANELQNLIKNSAGNIKYEQKADYNGSAGKSSASKAGQKTADAYLEAFNEELKELDKLKDQGKISEKKYLDALRLLYERYFKNIDKYAKEFAENQTKYLKGMASMYESVFSYISGEIGKRISALGDERDAQTDSLKSQQEAAEAAYQSEIDSIDDTIKALEEKKDALQEQIDAKKDEIDAIREAAEERKREIDLQKAQYELARAQNQKSILQYSGEKGMHYTTDASSIHSAREEVENAQEEIDIAKIEAEIRLLENAQEQIDHQINSLNERKESIEAVIDASNAYFETQIEATEQYYNAIIDSMEAQQSKWDELLDLKKHAEMLALVEQLGFTEEEILSGTGDAYQAFRDQYLSVLKDMYSGNGEILTQLDQLTGMDVTNMAGYIEATASAFDSLSAKTDNATKSVEALTGALYGTGPVAAGNTASPGTMQNQQTQAAGGSLADALNDLPSVGYTEFQNSTAEILSILDQFITSLKEKWQQVQDITRNALLGSASEEGSGLPAAEGSEAGSSNGAKNPEKKGTSDSVVGILESAATQIDSLLNGKEESLMAAFTTLLEVDPTLSDIWASITKIFNDSCDDITKCLDSLMKKIDEFIAKCKSLEPAGGSSFQFDFGVNDKTGNQQVLPHIQNYNTMMTLLSDARPAFSLPAPNPGILNRNMNITQNQQQMQTVHQTFNVSMPNITNAASAESLMNDLQLLGTKKYHYFN